MNNNKQSEKTWNTVIDICANITAMYHDLDKDQTNFLMMLLRRACRFSVPETNLVKRLFDLYQIEKEEIEYMINIVYKEELFGKDWFILKTIILDKPTLLTAPNFPTDIYGHLPSLLKKSVDVIAEGRHRDMFLMSALTVLSGCIHNFDGLYDGKIIFPNIYSFVVAPAASGKGVMQYAKRLGQKYHKALLNDSTHSEVNKVESNEDAKDVTPMQRLLYLPANSSAAAFVEKLKNSQGRAVLFETEADTITSTLKNDWGGYSEILRCAFHHEAISVNRKGKDGLVEIETPRLSISISGTPIQVTSLYKSQENGLFSRFAFYAYNDFVQWKDVSPSFGIANKDEYFDQMAEDVVNLVEFCEASETRFSYTGKQWEELNEKFSLLMDYFGLEGNNAILSVLVRQGLIRFKISMILSALRMWEKQKKEVVYECTDEDYETAAKIADVLLAHSLIVTELIPKNDPNLGNSEQKFYAALPDKFNRLEAVEIGEGLNLKSRSCDGNLKKLVDKGRLQKVANGLYRKI